ncbi:SAM-dependent methyltransferase [Undibacterium luofuense]|uniref:SAM-dependent methyltransferase n=1 Tax=Undibacterium luofuense TaxID=2828733 RepID=UPI0030EC82C1
MTQKGTLFLLPNTLGNHSDTSDILQHIIPEQVQQRTTGLRYLIAENAKTARAHLKLVANRHPLQTTLQEIRISELNINTPANALDALLEPLLNGEDAGLISEAGVPAVADPGAALVRLAHQRGITVRPLVGPSSLLLAVMGSGLNGQSFAFHGYLPTDAAQRAKRIKELEERSRKEKQTQLFIETPYRNAAFLEALLQHCNPSTSVCVATDLTLDTESLQTRSAAEWKKHIASAGQPDFHKKPTVFLFLAA